MPLLGSDPVTGLDGEADSLLGYRSPMHGQRPQVRLAATRGEEFGLLSERVRSWLAAGFEPGAIGVTARSAGLVRQARGALAADGLDTTSISGRGGAAGVRAGTMHAMKGLEFRAVAVIGVEEGMVPDPAAITADDEDPLAHAQDLQRERCVLFVACTRARDHLYVSATGKLSAFLPLHGAAAPLPDAGPAPASHPAVAVPPQPHQPTDPPVGDHDAGQQDGSVEPRPSDASGPRKVSMRELLRRREESWAPRLRGASLVAEADLRPDHTNQVAEVLAQLYRKLPGPGERRGRIPAPLAGLPSIRHGWSRGRELPGREVLAGALEGHWIRRHRTRSGDLGAGLQKGGRAPGHGHIPWPPADVSGPDPDACRAAQLLPAQLRPVAARPAPARSRDGCGELPGVGNRARPGTQVKTWTLMLCPVQ